MTTVSLNKEIVNETRKYAEINNRSLPRQIEHWLKIGRIMEDNPDLTYEFVQGVLIGMKEMENGELTEYKFGDDYS